MRHLFYIQIYRLFTSKGIWVCLALTQFILAWRFVVSLELIAQQQTQAAYQQLAAGVTDIALIPLFKLGSILLIVIVPFLTAQSIAGEKQQNTWVLLKAAPYSLFTIVMAKFATLLVVSMAILLQIILLCVAVFFITSPDVGVLFTSAIGFLLHTSTMIALGLLVSCYFQHAIKAAVSSLCLFVILHNFHWLQLDAAIDFGVSISWSANLVSAYAGILATPAIIYFISSSVFFLSWTTIKLESE